MLLHHKGIDIIDPNGKVYNDWEAVCNGMIVSVR